MEVIDNEVIAGYRGLHLGDMGITECYRFLPNRFRFFTNHYRWITGLLPTDYRSLPIVWKAHCIGSGDISLQSI